MSDNPLTFSFPALYHPEHPHNKHPDPGMRKTLTPCHQAELEALLRIGWEVAPDDFLKADKK